MLTKGRFLIPLPGGKPCIPPPTFIHSYVFRTNTLAIYQVTKKAEVVAIFCFGKKSFEVGKMHCRENNRKETDMAPITKN